MFETAGTLTIVELTSSLVALVLLPLLWAAVCGFVALRGAGGRLAVRTAVVLGAATLALAITHATWAALGAAGHITLQHVATLARIGQLDVGLDLVRDPTSVSCAVLVALLGFAAVLHVALTAPAAAAGRLAWTGLATSAVMLIALSDSLPLLAIGLSVATLAGWVLSGGGKPRLLALALAGDVTVLFAAWILFWSLGGTFSTSGYTPDPLPRFAIVAVPDGARADGKVTVSLTTYPDALVSSDDGPPLPGEPIRAPLALTLDPGVYSFRIQAGAATMDMLVTHVTLAANHAYVLTPFGPTTSLSNLDDQLVVARPVPAGAASMRTILASRFFAGVHVPSAVAFLLVLGSLLRLGLLARTDRGGLAHALEVVPPVVITLHALPLVDPAAAAAIAIAPALAAVLFAGDAASSRSADRVPRAAAAALAALAMTSALVGETAGAVVLVFAASLGAAAATAALDANADVRWLGVACASLAGVLPGAGASPGIASVIGGAFAASSAGRWPGAVVAPLAAIATILVALAVFRVYSASIRAPGVEPGPAFARILVIVLASTSLVGAALLGVGASPFGGKSAPLARRLVDAPGGFDDNPRVALAAVGLSVAAAAIGLVAARRATATARTPSWLVALGQPAALVGWAAARGAGVVRFLVRSVVIMNEDIVDDATEAVAALFAALGRVLRLVDAKASTSLVARGLSRGADEVVVRTGMDDPRRFERVRTVLVLGMVAILGLVVLSSVVLG